MRTLFALLLFVVPLFADNKLEAITAIFELNQDKNLVKFVKVYRLEHETDTCYILIDMLQLKNQPTISCIKEENHDQPKEVPKVPNLRVGKADKDNGKP